MDPSSYSSRNTCRIRLADTLPSQDEPATRSKASTARVSPLMTLRPLRSNPLLQSRTPLWRQGLPPLRRLCYPTVLSTSGWHWVGYRLRLTTTSLLLHLWQHLPPAQCLCTCCRGWWRRTRQPLLCVWPSLELICQSPQLPSAMLPWWPSTPRPSWTLPKPTWKCLLNTSGIYGWAKGVGGVQPTYHSVSPTPIYVYPCW